MTNQERAMRACGLMRTIQERMESGAMLAFDRHHPQQRAACRRMLRYVALIRWLYARAVRADEATAVAFREGCLGMPWPYGGIDNGDTAYFTLVGQYGCVDVEDDALCPA